MLSDYGPEHGVGDVVACFRNHCTGNNWNLVEQLLKRGYSNLYMQYIYIYIVILLPINVVDLSRYRRLLMQ